MNPLTRLFIAGLAVFQLGHAIRLQPTSRIGPFVRPPPTLPSRAIQRVAVGAAAAALISAAASPAWATSVVANVASSTEHLHLGQKVANIFRGKGLTDEVVIMLIAAMPVLELRGAIPVGVWMGIPIVKVIALAVLGNIAPIAPLLFALRFGPVQKVEGLVSMFL